MNELLFYIGIFIGITFMQGVTTIRVLHKKKPYLLAFALLSFTESLFIATEVVCYLWFGIDIPEAISLGLDYIIMPLFYFEILCLTNQDIDSFSWAKRLQRTLLVAIPIFIYLILIFSLDISQPNIITNSYIFTYVVVVMALMFYHTRKFHLMLKEGRPNKNTEKQDIVWVHAILFLMILQYTMYLVYEILPYYIIYYIIIYVTVILHGYFIHKQLPTNTRKLMAMHDELKEKQEVALEELKDVTKGLKRKMDMDTTLKAFRVEHPSFDIRLRELTESKLTQRDLYLCILIYQGKRIPEIADFLGISLSSVEVARHRLRTKLNLGKGTNMNRIIQSAINGN